MERFNVLVIGGGAAGMAAAVSAAKYGSVLLVERDAQAGGVLTQCIHYGFGMGYFHEDMTGQEYARRWRSMLKSPLLEVRLGTTVLTLWANKTALLSREGQAQRVCFDACILAAGCREKSIGSLALAGTRPAGVFTAGETQRMINRLGYLPGREIVILGSGDVGQIMARQFVQMGLHVITMVELEPRLGGLARNRRDCIEALHIPVRLNTTVIKLHGQGRLCGVTLRETVTGAEEYIPCDTLVTALGLIPDRDLWPGLAPKWLWFSGNCQSVHNIVESVTAHGLAAGNAAGLYAATLGGGIIIPI